jgi:predicted ester cyclase
MPTDAEPDANKRLIRRFLEEASRRGIQTAADASMAADVVSHPPASASPAPLAGREAYKRFAAAQFGAFPDLAVTVEDAIAEGDRVAVRVTARGTHAGALPAAAPPQPAA